MEIRNDYTEAKGRPKAIENVIKTCKTVYKLCREDEEKHKYIVTKLDGNPECI
jgi:hypothetical protein